MNFLAHIFLSGDDRRMQVGNFIGDAVKGSCYNDYPPAIRSGILLHRQIDDFTDNHPDIKRAVRLLKPNFGRYSGVLLDIYFDHFLASHFNEYSPVPLKRFASKFYLSLILSRRCLPPRIKRFMWHFILTDRLSKYSTVRGVGQSLDIMVTYGRMDISVEEAVNFLIGHQEELYAVFKPFFAQLRDFCNDRIETSGSEQDKGSEP